MRDDCNLGIQFDGSFAFIKVPPVQIVYRSPACILPPPPPIPDTDYSDYADIPESIHDSDLFLIIPNYTYHYYSYAEANAWNALTINFKNRGVEGVIGETPIKATIEVNWQFKRTGLNVRGVLGMFGTGEGDYPRLAEHAKAWRNLNGTIEGEPYDDDSLWTQEFIFETYSYWNGSTTYEYSNNGLFQGGDGQFYHLPSAGNVRFIGARRSELIVDPDRPRNFKRTSLHTNGIVFTIDENRVTIHPLHEKPTLFIPPPPPPPMSCCPNVQLNDQLLRLILKKIGSDSLPASVPKVLTNKAKGTMQIENLAQFISYTVKQLDALCGQYPIEVKIKDADLTQEGDQEKTVKLPNMAETLAEIFGLLLIIRSESDANLSATVRGLIEIGSAKQAAILAHDYAKANAEYLGYKGTQVERKVPFAFKPGEQRLDAMLKEGEISLKGWENDDKEDLNTHLAPLLEHAAMWKNQNFRNLGAADPLTKLKSLLATGGDAASIINQLTKNHKKEPDPDHPEKETDFDAFINQVEQGFISKPGITDPTNPYGRPLAHRPKIREIGEDTSDTDE